MATDSRIDRLEVTVDALRNDVQNLRSDFRDLRSEFRDFSSEVNSRINTLLVVSIGLWVTTIGTLVGLYFTRT